MKISKHKQVYLPENTSFINIIILKEEIQKEIWKINPNLAEIYGTRLAKDLYCLYVLTNESKQYPYTRIDIEG